MNFLKFLISKTFFINLFIAILLFILIGWITLLTLDFFTQHGKAVSVPDFKGMTTAEIEKVCNENDLRYQVIDSVYVDDVARGAVVEQNPKADFKVKENRTIFLTMNAVMPERVSMPDLVGVSLRQAKAYLETYGLKVGRLKYEPDIAKDVVLKQMYKGKRIEKGTLIEKRQKVDLVLGMGEGSEQTLVPSIAGLTLKEAKLKLTEFSLNLGAIVADETVLTSKDSAVAKIWKQSPRPSSEPNISLGGSVDIWISKNTNLSSSEDSTDTENEESEE
jgi:beta-lactam-binding protein with PASTA domain